MTSHKILTYALVILIVQVALSTAGPGENSKCMCRTTNGKPGECRLRSTGKNCNCPECPARGTPVKKAPSTSDSGAPANTIQRAVPPNVRKYRYEVRPAFGPYITITRTSIN